MTPQTLGLIVGGLVPAILFGITGPLAKMSTQAGIGLGIYTLLVGLGVCAAGLALWWWMPDTAVSWKSAAPAVVFGFTWGLGVAAVGLGLTTFKMPVSVLAPLYNMNTLVAVLLSLWLFAEWKDVKLLPLLAGSALIVAGGVLVSRS